MVQHNLTEKVHKTNSVVASFTYTDPTEIEGEFNIQIFPSHIKVSSYIFLERTVSLTVKATSPFPDRRFFELVDDFVKDVVLPTMRSWGWSARGEVIQHLKPTKYIYDEFLHIDDPQQTKGNPDELWNEIVNFTNLVSRYTGKTTTPYEISVAVYPIPRKKEEIFTLPINDELYEKMKSWTTDDWVNFLKGGVSIFVAPTSLTGEKFIEYLKRGDPSFPFIITIEKKEDRI